MGQGNTKHNTKYPGVRYRNHPTRKARGKQPERYFTIRYRHDGKLTEKKVGWASEGWTAEKAHAILVEIKRKSLLATGREVLPQ